MDKIKYNLFECVFLSVDRYCMDKSDLDWEKCSNCSKTNNCEYCLFDGVKGDLSFCMNCKLKGE